METQSSAENLGEEFNQTTCEEKLKKSKETEPVCPAVHCQDFQYSKLYHEECGERGMYAPVQVVGCYNSSSKEWYFGEPETLLEACEEKHKQNPSWKLSYCYCCCSCFANKTLIGLPDKQVCPIFEITTGDFVMAGTVGRSGSLEWNPTRVGFSQGTTEGIEPAMVYLVYGDGQQMIASTDQPLMLSDRSMTTASRIVPGRDSLMGVDGAPLEVTLASLGSYTGGIHHIATNKAWTGSIDDHLIQANGVVAGDFMLQLHFPEVSNQQKVAGWSELPEIGTPEYVEVHSHLQTVGDSYAYAVPADAAEIDSDMFVAYGGQAELPLGTQSFVTARQAEDILNKGEQEPITERSGYALAQEAVALVSGFYRDFVYYIDWSRYEPNVYAFEQYGQKVVLISGGLARMKGIGFTGLTMAIAQGVARFLAGEPETGYGYSCTGEADMYAFGAMSQKVWFGKPWLEQTLSAIEQLTDLFDLIDPENAKGNPLNVCEEPSIECRFQTWSAALAGGALPECAGGPPRTPLMVEQVRVLSDTQLQVVFNEPPMPSQAEKTSAYKLTPSGTIVSAKVDGEENFIVNVGVDALAPGTYTLSCSGLEGTNKGKLDPDPTLVEFEVKEKAEL